MPEIFSVNNKQAIREEIINLMACAMGLHGPTCHCGCREKLAQAAIAYAEIVKAARKAEGPEKKKLDFWYQVEEEP